MSKYHKRVITYDNHTQNYKCEIPELGIEILADTESSALIFIRQEIENYIKAQSKLVKKLETSLYSEYGND